MDKKQQALIIAKCKENFSFFCENFCKIKHPSGNIFPFRLFKYQKKSVSIFKKNKYVIYRKCRQSGISTLTGAYVLWFSMFHPGMQVLIVSKRDEDAIAYLDRNVKFVYEHLPDFFFEIFGDPRDSVNKAFSPLKTYNEHTIEFWHGSKIKSLTSSKDTLRSNSASLIIIDEAAFIPDMEEMWTSGQPTLIHGGSVIVISTTNGRGNWYHNTWEDAVDKKNDFVPIEIPWWEMDWKLTWRDGISNRQITLEPTSGIRSTKDKAEKAKFGPYWSPWLDDQYRQLQQKGEAWKFRQEILMDFIGSGNTVINQDSLVRLLEAIDPGYQAVVRPIKYESIDGSVSCLLDFAESLYVWEKPIRSTKAVFFHNKIIRPGTEGHQYSIGVDISTGEHNDFSAVEILDVTIMEQVAELQIKVEPTILARMVDYLGRLYNNALVVVESTGIGKTVCQDLQKILFYPNLYHRRTKSGKRDTIPGFPTTGPSKAYIIKALIESVGIDPEEGSGVTFKSHRFNREANSFIHLGGGRVGNERGSGNNDDLMIAGGLAIIGIPDAMISADGMAPVRPGDLNLENISPQEMDELLKKGGNISPPIIVTGEGNMEESIEQQLIKFTTQLGGVDQSMIRKINSDTVRQPKKYY